MNANETAVKLLESGKKINLGDIIASDQETVINKPALVSFLDNKLTEWDLFIPEGQQDIKANAFSGKSSGPSSAAGLTCLSIYIPESVTEIGGNAFSNCADVSHVIIPDSVESVGDSAFSDCTSLISVEYSKETSFGNGVFSGTSIPTLLYSNTGIIYVPNNITGEVIIPDGITTIGDETFKRKSNLTKVVIPGSVVNLGQKVFSYCTSLKDIVFEDGDIESLGSQWCIGSSSSNDTYTDVTLKFTDVKPLTNTMGWNSNVRNYFVPDNLVDSYKSATNWSSMSSKIKPFSYLVSETSVLYGLGSSMSATISAKAKVGESVLTSVTCDSSYVTVDEVLGNSFKITASTCSQHNANFSISYTVDGVEHTQTLTVSIAVFATGEDALSTLGAVLVATDETMYLDYEKLLADGKTLQGLLVSNGTHYYVLGVNYIPSVCYGGGENKYEYWGGYGKEIDPDHYFGSSSAAKTDFDGEGNTQRIVAGLTKDYHDNNFNKAPWSAAGLCAEYTFPYGNKGYMPAAGELQIAISKKDWVKSLLAQVNGTTLEAFNSYIWSSSQYSA